MATNLKSFSDGVLANTSGTTTTISGLSFQPKVVIIWADGITTGGQGAEQTGGYSVGFSDGTNHRYSAQAGDDAVSTTNVGRATSTTKAVGILTSGTPTVTNEATIAMTSDGFTINFNTTPAATYPMSYLALGGTDLANVAIGTNTMPTVTGNKVTSGLGFTPNFVMLISGSLTTATTSTNVKNSYGCAISSSKRFGHAWAVQDAQTMSANVNGVSWHRTDACLIGLTTAAASEYVADFVSFDSGAGFTINFSTAPASAYQFFYLAIGGTNLKWDIGIDVASLLINTVTTHSGTSFQPEVVMWSTSSQTALNSIGTNAQITAGFCSGSNQDCDAQWHHNDSINTFVFLAGGGHATNTTTDVLEERIDNTTNRSYDTPTLNSDGWGITGNKDGSAIQISSVMLAGTTAGSETVGEMVASTQFGQIQPILEKIQIIDY